MSDAAKAGGLQPIEVTATTPILDVRHHAGKRQIRGALRYDAKALLDAEPLALPLPHDGPIAVYAESDAAAEEVAERLRRGGYAGALPLVGGIVAWERAGLAVEESTQEQPVPGESGGLKRL